MDQMGQNQCFVQFARWRHGGGAKSTVSDSILFERCVNSRVWLKNTHRFNSVAKYRCDLLMLGSDVALYSSKATRCGSMMTSLLLLLLLFCDVTFSSGV